MRRSLGIAGLLIATIALGCGDEGDGEEEEIIDSSAMAGDSGGKPPTDSGTAVDSGARTDAGGSVDAGGNTPVDAGFDAGGSDAGALDAGSSDSGAADSGASDGGARDSGAGDSGASDGGARDSGAGDSGAAATFTRVYAIFSVCTGCHGSSSGSGLNMSSKATAYTELTTPGNAEGPMCMGNNRKRVIPNDPDNSLLIKKLSGTQDCGGRMPAGGNPALSAAQIAEVRSWISAGAMNN